MPTVNAWEPTLHELTTNPASPWVLVRASDCGHTKFFIERKRIKRFRTATLALEFAATLNKTLYETHESVILHSIEYANEGVEDEQVYNIR